jgi:uncharacterized transporter YbjL
LVDASVSASLVVVVVVVVVVVIGVVGGEVRILGGGVGVVVLVVGLDVEVSSEEIKTKYFEYWSPENVRSLVFFIDL